MDLVKYIHYALAQSYEIQNLRDRARLSELDLSSVEHRYDVIVTPDSSIMATNHNNRVSIGLQGSQENIYGGRAYSSISTSQSKSALSHQQEYSLKSSIGYTQSIFRKFGSLYNTLSLFSAKERKIKTQIEIEESKKDIIFQAITKYYHTVLAREQIAIYDLATKRAKQNYRASKAKQEAGIVSKIDVHRAKLSYLNAKINQGNALKNYKDALAEAFFFINQEEQREPFIKEIKKVSYHFDIDWHKVISTNARWKILLINEKILDREIYNAYSDVLPDIKVDVKYHTYNRDERFRDSLAFDNRDWSISLSSDYSFDSHDEEIAIERLKISKNRLIQDKERLSRLIKKEIGELLNSFENIKEVLNLQKLREEEAEESLKIAQIRYERGLSSNLDILDAENNLLNAQISSISALVRYNSSIFQLAHRLNLLDLAFVEEVFR
jgi:outer membrane protein TolC